MYLNSCWNIFSSAINKKKKVRRLCCTSTRPYIPMIYLINELKVQKNSSSGILFFNRHTIYKLKYTHEYRHIIYCSIIFLLNVHLSYSFSAKKPYYYGTTWTIYYKRWHLLSLLLYKNITQIHIPIIRHQTSVVVCPMKPSFATYLA